MKTALTIAGSDSCGGAGIQADIKTMTVNGVYAMSAVTALTAQNTTGVFDIMEVTPRFLEEQLEAVFTDIRPDAVKIGMVSSENLIKVIADSLKKFQAEKIVLDPVMVSSSGTRLMKEQALKILKRELLPLVDLVTPNIPEAEILWGHPISSREDMENGAGSISDTYGISVLCKGGHLLSGADDVLCVKVQNGNLHGERITWFPGERILNPNTHGTGCTLSSAIAANLAKGYELPEAVFCAKKYLNGALRSGLDLGAGSGPMNHGYVLDICQEKRSTEPGSEVEDIKQQPFEAEIKEVEAVFCKAEVKEEEAAFCKAEVKEEEAAFCKAEVKEEKEVP